MGSKIESMSLLVFPAMIVFVTSVRVTAGSLSEAMPLPKQYDASARPQHPYLRDYASSFAYDRYFDAHKLKKAIAAYYGLCSFVDDNIGKVMRTLEAVGLARDTRVLYTSDHGDNLGARGLWGKSTMYEEVAGVPHRERPRYRGRFESPHAGEPRRHVPFHHGMRGEHGEDLYDDHPGISLTRLARGEQPDRSVLSEYHGMGSTTGAFMIRHGPLQIRALRGLPPQLFDMASDPEELHDLAGDARYAAALEECRQRLYAICDPAAVESAPSGVRPSFWKSMEGRCGHRARRPRFFPTARISLVFG